MPNYIAHFAFTRPKSDLRPEDQRHGVGAMPINTDKVPTTSEEKKEIAKTIFRLGDYETVIVTQLEPTDHFVEDSGEILEGLIVNDK